MKHVDGIARRHGHNLPHWTAHGATYFVTFRLADSLPAKVVAKFEAEYRDVIRAEEESLKRNLSIEEIKKAKARLRNKLEKFLDSGHGACDLAKPGCAQVVREALGFFDCTRYRLGAWAVMPNHAHAILKPAEDQELSLIVKSWKSFTSREINRLVARSGRLWQSEPFDHLIRNDESLRKLSKYVLDNPVTAGLIDWDWIGVGSLGIESRGGDEP